MPVAAVGVHYVDVRAAVGEDDPQPARRPRRLRVAGDEPREVCHRAAVGLHRGNLRAAGRTALERDLRAVGRPVGSAARERWATGETGCGAGREIDYENVDV